ncbi:MAG: 3-deoxy-7-phosphoheptulonate synthase [Bacilli bacterium]|nr:3-deoxy-7-phosphoheptulonate synthase [Bacilli bacterium]
MKLVKNYNKHFKIDKFEKGKDLLIIAGPCSIESEEQLLNVASKLVENNVYYMRSAFYKPRTSPYSFQGLGEAGIEIIKKIKSKYDIKIVSEIVNINNLDLYKDYVDIIQIGARNMQNFELLKAVGKVNKPILLKRGFGNTIEEWLNAAEYIMYNGNENIILCERGIKTFENSTRNTLDISSIGVVNKLTKLPIIVDPSHASGRRDLVKSLSLAAIAAGSDGLMIEVHPSPTESISDSDQAISFSEFEEILHKSRLIFKTIKE